MKEFEEDFEEDFDEGVGWTPNRKKFKNKTGNYIVQGLFLEDSYNTNLAVYTFDGEDKTYKGKVYPSLKRLYLEYGDVKEYSFANKYLYDWPHWERLCKNVIVSRHIEMWRRELELSLESESMLTMVSLADGGSYQAAKYLADRGWGAKRRGRPSNEEVAGELERQVNEAAEFDEDFKLLTIHKGDKK